MVSDAIGLFWPMGSRLGNRPMELGTKALSTTSAGRVPKDGHGVLGADKLTYDDGSGEAGLFGEFVEHVADFRLELHVELVSAPYGHPQFSHQVRGVYELWITHSIYTSSVTLSSPLLTNRTPTKGG